MHGKQSQRNLIEEIVVGVIGLEVKAQSTDDPIGDEKIIEQKVNGKL